MNKLSFTISIFGLKIFKFEKETNYSNDTTANSSITIKPKDAESKKEPIVKSIHSNYQGSVKPDLKELEKQLNPVEEIPNLIVTCKTCKGTTYDDDINICSKCEKPTCSLCGNYDPASRCNFCNECWINI